MRKPGSAEDAQYMKTVRQAVGLSQPGLARRLHLTPGQISHIENGRRPIPDYARAELQRLQARSAADGILAPEPCSPPMESADAMMRHVEGCPQCIAAIYRAELAARLADRPLTRVPQATR